MIPSYLIYVVDDDELIRHYIEFSMGDIYTVKVYSNAESALKDMKKKPPHLILLDNRLPGMSGLDALRKIKSDFPDMIVIMITGLKEVDFAVTAMKLGAYDYILKPFHKDSLRKTIQNALESVQLRKEIFNLHEKYLRETCPTFTGKSDELLDIIEIVNRISNYPYTPVLILGEKGIGKELIAQTIHARSPNYREPLVSLNCGAVPAKHLESELFGNENGGAGQSKRTGLIEAASEGALFLNDIGDIPKDIQTKLLLFLESGTFCSVGSDEIKSVRLRLITATSKNLMQLIKEGCFLQDLYHQIAVETIGVPVLNQRPDDITALAKYFLNDYKNRYNKNILGFSPEAENGLKRHHWKGNVPELRNLIERSVINSDTQMITLNDIFPETRNEYKIINMFPPLTELVLNMTDMIGIIEKHYIEEALRLTKGNESHAAKMLGMSRDRLRYRRAKHKI